MEGEVVKEKYLQRKLMVVCGYSMGTKRSVSMQ